MSSLESILMTWAGLAFGRHRVVGTMHKTKGCDEWQKDDRRDISQLYGKKRNIFISVVSCGIQTLSDCGNFAISFGI